MFDVPQARRIARSLGATLVLLCVPTVGAFAQLELGLEDLVARALEENYQIQVFRNGERVAANNNTIGNAGMLPTVTLTGELRSAINNSRQQFFTGDSQQATNARRNSSSLGVEANWVVFDGLAMFARRDRLDQLQTLSQADTRFFLEQTVADLATAYYQLRQETELLITLQNSLDVSQARVRFAERAAEIGTGTQLELQLARVDRNTDSSLVLNQRAQIGEVTLAVNRLINRELTAELVPVDSITLVDNLSLPVLLEQARTQNAALRQQQLAELIALTDAEIAKGTLYPELSLYGRYDYNRQANEIGFLESSRSFGPDYGIRVRFNLFSGYQQKIVRENTLIGIETEKLRTADLHQQIEQAVRVAYLRWETARLRVSLERESIRAAEEALAIARRQYELGAITDIEFRIIQLNVVQATARFLEARFAAKQREIELLRLSGGVL